MFTILLLLLCHAALLAQRQQTPAVTRSTEILTDGSSNRYYLHAVKPGETIYSICRAYAVEQEELMRDNPALSGGLKVGQWLKIMVTPGSDAVQLTKHVVRAKETLYSIARMYGSSVSAILAANPHVSQTLPVGAVLQIPAPSQSANPEPSTLEQNLVGSSSSNEDRAALIEHVAQRRETLFSISNLYEVDMDYIKQYNPQIFGGKTNKIKVGQIVYIPIVLSGLKNSRQQSAAAASLCDSSASYNAPINVAILFPFDAKNQDDEETLYKSFRFVEMYEGALLALETLSGQGVSVNLSVLDSKSVDESAWAPGVALDKADLIIGPVYQERFIPVAKFARQRNIKIVSPLTPIDTLLYSYPNVFQTPATFNTQVQSALTHEHLDPAQSNIILISQRDEEDSQRLRTYYRQYLPKRDSIVYHNSAMRIDSLELEQLRYAYETREHRHTVKNLSYRIGVQPRENQETFLKIFQPHIDNKVVVASQDEPFVSELLANLKAFADRYKCSITVYGSNDWQKYEKVERKLFYDLKLHLAAPYFIDYKSETVKRFVQAYRNRYKTEPSQFAFQGYDVMLYFASAIYRYGKDFENCLPSHHEDLLQSTYSFVPVVPNGAYENKGVFLLRYTPWMEIVRYR
jgi:LysM repeat protein/ABC-type branched-subunit amino acid transport system substrate-binding protein